MGKRRTAHQDPTRVEVANRRPNSDVFTVNASEGLETVRQAPGQPFGRYTLLRRLASGGMGEIFLAKQGGQGGFSKIVAIKRILSHYKEDDEHVRMFFDEAKLQALLSDRHIVQIYDMGEIDDHLFIAMEYVHGVSWRKLLERAQAEGQQVHPAHAVDLAVQVARGLSYAHNVKGSHGEPLNVVHRDINPQNIIVSFDGEVKIIDFGIAKSDINDVHTTTGTLKGKFAYMSPEQGSGEKLDRRSDIFSFGICLWELLGQKNPFKRGNVVASLAAIQTEPHMKIGSLHKAYRPFDHIVDKALAKTADGRYNDCSEIAEDLVDLYASGKLGEPEMPLATWLQALFAEEMEDHLALLDRVGAGQGISRRGNLERSSPIIASSPYGVDAETSEPRRRRAAKLHDAPTAVLADGPDTAEPSLFDGVATAPGPPPNLATFDSQTDRGPVPSLVDITSGSGHEPLSLDSSEYVALNTSDESVGALMENLPLVDDTPPKQKGDTDPTVSAPTSVEALSGEVVAAPARGRSLVKGTLFGLGVGMAVVLGLVLLALPPSEGDGAKPTTDDTVARTDDDATVTPTPDGTDPVVDDGAEPSGTSPSSTSPSSTSPSNTRLASANARRTDKPAKRTDSPAVTDEPDDGDEREDETAASEPAAPKAEPPPANEPDEQPAAPADDPPQKTDDKTSTTAAAAVTSKPAKRERAARATPRPRRDKSASTEDKPKKQARAEEPRKEAKEPSTRAEPPPEDPKKTTVATRQPSAKLDARAPSGYRLSGGSARRTFGVGSKGVTVKIAGPEDGHSFALRLEPTEGGAIVNPKRECRTILRFNGAGVRCGGTFKLPYGKRSVLQVASPGKQRIEIVLKLSAP